MRVELLYMDDCPNWTVANERLTQALSIIGRADVNVAYRRVETVEQAADLSFVGSPTIRVNGIDPFASAPEQVGLACRIYATPDGFDGSPTIDQMVQALSESRRDRGARSG